MRTGAATGLVTTTDGRSLAEIAGTAGSPSSFDAERLHALLAALPAGRWASYGDVSEPVGTAAQPLGRHITTCSRCVNAWRILQDSGRPAPGFRWADGRADTPRELLASEGIAFLGHVADPSQRLSHQELAEFAESSET